MANTNIALRNIRKQIEQEKCEFATQIEEIQQNVLILIENFSVRKESRIFCELINLPHPFFTFEKRSELDDCKIPRIDEKKKSNGADYEEDKNDSSTRPQAKKPNRPRSKNTYRVQEEYKENSAVFECPESFEVPRTTGGKSFPQQKVNNEDAPSEAPSKPKVRKPRGPKVPKKELAEFNQPQQGVFTRSQSRKAAILCGTSKEAASSSIGAIHMDTDKKHTTGSLAEKHFEPAGGKRANGSVSKTAKSTLPREDKKRKYTRKGKNEAAPLDLSTATKVDTEKVVVPSTAAKRKVSTTRSRRTTVAVLKDPGSPPAQEEKKRKYTRSKKKNEEAAKTVTSTPCGSRPIDADLSQGNKKRSYTPSKRNREVVPQFDLVKDTEDTGGSIPIDVDLSKGDKKRNYTPAKKNREVVPQFDLFRATKDTAGSIPIEADLSRGDKKRKYTPLKRKLEDVPQFDLAKDTKDTGESIPIDVELSKEGKKRKYTPSKGNREVVPQFDLVKDTKDTGVSMPIDGYLSQGEKKRTYTPLKRIREVVPQFDLVKDTKDTSGSIPTDVDSSKGSKKRNYTPSKRNREVVPQFDFFRATTDTGGSIPIEADLSRGDKKRKYTPSKGNREVVPQFDLIKDTKNTAVSMPIDAVQKYSQSKGKTGVATFDLFRPTKDTGISIPLAAITTGPKGADGAILIEHKSAHPQEDQARKNTQSKGKTELSTFDLFTHGGSVPIDADLPQDDKIRKYTQSKGKTELSTFDLFRPTKGTGSTKSVDQTATGLKGPCESVLVDQKFILAQEGKKSRHTQSKGKTEVVSTISSSKVEKQVESTLPPQEDVIRKYTQSRRKNEVVSTVNSIPMQVETPSGSKGTSGSILIDHKSTLSQTDNKRKHAQSKAKIEVPVFDLWKPTNETGGSIPIQVESTSGLKGPSNNFLLDPIITLPQEDKKRKYTHSHDKNESATSDSFSERKAKKPWDSHVQNIPLQSNISKDITGELLADPSVPKAYHKQGASIQSKAKNDGPLKIPITPNAKSGDRRYEGQQVCENSKSNKFRSQATHELVLKEISFDEVVKIGEAQKNSNRCESIPLGKGFTFGKQQATNDENMFKSNGPMKFPQNRQLTNQPSFANRHNITKPQVSNEDFLKDNKQNKNATPSMLDVNLRNNKPENNQSSTVSPDSDGCVFQPSPARIFSALEKKYITQLLTTSPNEIKTTLMETINRMESKNYNFPINLDVLKSGTLLYLLNAAYAYVQYDFKPKLINLHSN